MLFVSAFALLLIGIIPVIACLIWARIDASNQVFFPVRRALTVACCLSMVPPAIIMMYLTAASSTGSGPASWSGATARIFIIGVVVFVFATIVGLTAYLVGHRGHLKHSQLDDSVMPEKPEETGNPYQPSSM